MDEHTPTRTFWADRPDPANHPEGDPLPGGQVDVVVVGAGILGLLTARSISAGGMSVAVVEQSGVGDGVTGRSTAKVTALHGTHYRELRRKAGDAVAAAYGAANMWGVEEIARIADRIDCGWVVADAVTYGTRRTVDVIDEEAAAVRTAGLPVAVEHDVDVGLADPAAAALTLADQGMLDPRRLCLGLATELRQEGVLVASGCRALGLDGDTLETTEGPVQASAVVLATHLPMLDRGGQFATAEPSWSYVVAGPVNRRVPTAMLYGLYEEGPTSVRTAAPGTTDVIVTGLRHDAATPDDHTRALEQWAIRNVGLETVSHRWAAHDYMSAKGFPSVGRLPGPGTPVYTGTGFGKWGFTNAAVAAQIISDSIAGRSPRWPELATGLGKVGWAAAADFVRHNAKVAQHFVGDRLAARSAVDVPRLQPGEAALGEVDGQRVGVHRTDDGSLVAVNPRCTHLGCLVGWNNVDRTWDCPCHGSRFAPDGTVVDGPATRDLARVEIDAAKDG